jgi:precorrin-6B methylase 2
VRDVLILADGIGAALDAVHASGWWHGDVAAGNVLFTGASNRDNGSGQGRPGQAQPVLADFGTARRIGEGPTENGQLILTPAVTAPEVWAGAGAGPASDLYSLGVLLYLALTGNYPFVADDPDDYCELHTARAARPPSQSAPALGEATDVVLLRALAKRPEARFASGAELAASLRFALGEDGLPAGPKHHPPTAPPQPAPSTGGSLTPAPTPDEESAVRAAGESLERFAASLNGRERAALQAVFELARTNEARAVEEIGRLSLQIFGVAQALLALEHTGAAAALSTRRCTTEELAAACAAPARSLGQVLDLLACVGVLHRVGDEVGLSPALEALYGGRSAIGAPARPFSEAAELWSHLPAWAATGKPALEMDEPDGGRYAPITPCLGAMFDTDAEDLATALVQRRVVSPGARVLDVGAGSGVWGLALVAALPGASTVALDRPRVLETTRIYAAAAGLEDRLTTLAGDWRDAPLPSAGFDLAVMANVCHLEPGAEVTRMLERVRTALRPGGSAVIVDTIPQHLADDAGALLQSIHLGLRTPFGGVHDEISYRHWLCQAGLEGGEKVPVRGNLTALLAHRPG